MTMQLGFAKLILAKLCMKALLDDSSSRRRLELLVGGSNPESAEKAICRSEILCAVTSIVNVWGPLL